MQPTTVQIIGALFFACALVHTFSTKYFENLAHRRPAHAGLWHLLGEVEVVFGFWAMLLILAMVMVSGEKNAVHYLDERNFTEAMFVFAIMVVAASRPILEAARTALRGIAWAVPMPRPMATFFVVLLIVPILGSFITEPAAMTLGALILRDQFFARGISTRLKYATLGALFVNISIGGTLTSFAAPPVLMVATTWNWDMAHMLTHFGWKAALAVFVNALAITMFFNAELREIGLDPARHDKPMPPMIIVIHILFLAGVVAFAHHATVFMALLLFFIGFTTAYPTYQSRLILREALLVAFFLGGLVVLGGLQEWWLRPVLLSLSDTGVYFGTTALTALTDNAALTYLGSLVPGLSESFKYALVAGAVTGGGLTVIANAPNPAGLSILKGSFDDETVNPLGLLAAALGPTIVAILAFQLL